ncbi:MAG: hypothetical protein JW909_13595 [Planctomycetes bacterium]|nr:hypothetical protein [Planctomycetota bacterium]
MKRIHVVAAAVILAAGIAIGAVSANYMINPAAVDQGGGTAFSSSYEMQGSIGGTAVGTTATSANYSLEVGYIGPAAAVDWLEITQLPTPDTIGGGGTSEFKWTSQKAGTYYIEVGGDGSIGSGTQIGTGTCAAGVEETTSVTEANLADDAANTVYVIVDAGGDVLAKQAGIVDDESAPAITLVQVAVAGTVDDATVTEVLVNGSSVAVAAGAYSGMVTTGMDSITVEATNGASQTVVKTVTVTQ